MKTAFEEMIEDELNGDIKSIDYYLEKEKEQITEAYDNGYEHGHHHYGDLDYYEETYKK